MPAKDSTTVAARRSRLKAWIDTHYGGRQAEFITDVFSRTGTQLNQGELSALLKPDGKSFGEKKAASLERLCGGMPASYLTNPLADKPISRSHQKSEKDSRFLRPDPVMLSKADLWVAMQEGAQGRRFPMERRWEEVANKYAELVAAGQDSAAVERGFLQQAKARLPERMRGQKHERRTKGRGKGSPK